MKLFKEGEEYRGYNEDECDDVVPLQSFVIEYRSGNDGEYCQGNGFLDDFQLHEGEWPSVDAASHGVGGNHEKVFDEGDAPRRENHQNQRPVGADVHFFELKVAVPGGGHKDVTDNQENDCKDSGFHNCLMVGAQAVRFARAELVGESGPDLFQVLDVLFALVVAVGPVEGVEMPVLKVQRGFYENAALHVHALALILGGGQKELSEGHVAGVQIHGAKPGRAVLLGNFQFDVVAPELDVDNGFAVYQILVAEKGTHGGVPDFVDVVVGKGKRERRERKLLFAKAVSERVAHGLYRLGIFSENPYDYFDFGWCP